MLYLCSKKKSLFMERTKIRRTREEIVAAIKRSVINKQRAIAESQLRINAEILNTL